MPTYRVTDPETGVTLKLTGDSPPTEAELEQIFSQYSQPSKSPQQAGIAQPAQEMMPEQSLDESVLAKPGMRVLSELAAATNKSIFEFIDFLGPNNVNAISQLVGSDYRMPTVSETLGSDGGYMEDGLARDTVQAIGNTVPAAVLAGQAMRTGAAALPKLSAGESAAKGTVRQMGQSTVKQDVAAGALAASGGEIGEEIGGAEGKLIGSVVAPMTAGLPIIGKEAFKSGVRKGSNRALKQSIDDFREIDSSPTLGQATGDPLREGIETRSSQIFGGGSIRRSIDKTINNMQARLKAIADDVSKTSGDVETGRVIQKGITGKDGFVARFQERSGNLWNKFDALIDPASQVNASNTQQTLNGLVRQSEVGKIFNNPMVARVKDALEASGGKVDYKTFRELRTAIGSRLGSKDLISDIPRADLKQLYGALSRDLEGLAAASGDDAVKAFARANKYTSAGHARLDDFVERIATKVDLDKVFSAMAKGGEGTQALNAMKRSLKPEEWEAVSANVIRQLGRATNANQDMAGEVFSVNKFLTDWNRLGSSKKVLFSGSKKLNDYARNLDKIARVAERVKQAGSEGANASGTGQMLANSGLGFGLAASAVQGNWWATGGILAAISANKGASTLMSSPRFINWLAQSSTVKDLPAHIARLELIGNTEGISSELADLLEDLKQRADVNPATNH